MSFSPEIRAEQKREKPNWMGEWLVAMEIDLRDEK